MLTYGLKKGTTNELLHIDAVPNGLQCGCVCPHCQHELIARNGGTKKIHHFAHASGADCGGARMTALHILAQKILERDKIVMLPAYKTEYVSHDAVLKEFYNVVLEQVWKDDSSTRKPDCVCTQEDGKNPLWVEIFCRHKVDDTRQLDIRRRQVYCIEIDFSDLLQTEYSEKDVINRLTTDTTHKRWICCPVWDKEEEEKSLKAQAQWEEQQRREAEERRQELERTKAEREHDEYLEQLAKEWRSNPDQNIVDEIIREIKLNPYDFIEKSMYIHLVPWQAWLNEYTRFPRKKEGLQVFYCLVRYYYNNIKLDDRRHIRWKVLDTPMWKLINQKERSDEEIVLLEYMIVIWAINLLNNHKKYSDPDSKLAKLFSKKANIRKGLMDIMLQGGDRSKFLEENVREQIRQEFSVREDGETIVQIFKICFPTVLRRKKAYSKSEPDIQKDIPEPSDNRGDYIKADPDAWVKLNEEFKKQEKYYK